MSSQFLQKMEEAENTTVSWDFCPIERPQHLPNITSDGVEDDQCYPMRTAEETTIFFNYEKMVGLWGNICVGILGLLGNLVNVVVLGQKDMRKNCFNQLLIGKFFWSEAEEARRAEGANLDQKTHHSAS